MRRSRWPRCSRPPTSPEEWSTRSRGARPSSARCSPHTWTSMRSTSRARGRSGRAGATGGRQRQTVVHNGDGQSPWHAGRIPRAQDRLAPDRALDWSPAHGRSPGRALEDDRPDAARSRPGAGRACDALPPRLEATCCVRLRAARVRAAAAGELRGSDVKVCALIGFLRDARTQVKIAEARQAMADGAGELELVLNTAALRAGDARLVLDELVAPTRMVRLGSANGGRGVVLLKAVIGTAALDDPLKKLAAKIVELGEVDFARPGPGMGPRGDDPRRRASSRMPAGKRRRQGPRRHRDTGRRRRHDQCRGRKNRLCRRLGHPRAGGASSGRADGWSLQPGDRGGRRNLDRPRSRGRRRRAGGARRGRGC